LVSTGAARLVALVATLVAALIATSAARLVALIGTLIALIASIFHACVAKLTLLVAVLGPVFARHIAAAVGVALVLIDRHENSPLKWTPAWTLTSHTKTKWLFLVTIDEAYPPDR
jgi:hypothetical protein